jgi:hypothetical protein
MGRYINNIEGKSLGTSFHSKGKVLIEAGAKLTAPNKFVPNMVCLVDNGHFAAAVWAYSEDEWGQFKADDGRPKLWFTLENVEKYATD